MRVVTGTGQKLRYAVSALLLLAFGYGVLAAAKDKHLFLIHVAPPIDPEAVQVNYLLTGDFGGVGGFRVDLGEQAIGIRLDQTSKPPKSLKALLYASGCEIGLYRVDDLKTSDRQAQFTCKPLPTLVIPSAFPRPAALRAYDL